ncbi:hypothetical protein [Streptomyces kronopolitis]|uniref:hypothetical protein n=1 Tax=Streptomyces kronopolitis TaxID=1612435 RepID=UPI003D98EA8E
MGALVLREAPGGLPDGLGGEGGRAGGRVLPPGRGLQLRGLALLQWLYLQMPLRRLSVRQTAVCGVLVGVFGLGQVVKLEFSGQILGQIIRNGVVRQHKGVNGLAAGGWRHNALSKTPHAQGTEVGPKPVWCHVVAGGVPLGKLHTTVDVVGASTADDATGPAANALVRQELAHPADGRGEFAAGVQDGRDSKPCPGSEVREAQNALPHAAGRVFAIGAVQPRGIPYRTGEKTLI